MTSFYIEQPNYDSLTSFQDKDSETIALYLVDNVNSAFRTLAGTNVIKSYRTHNDVQIPLNQFPCLKVYPATDSIYIQRSPYLTSQYIAAYIMAFNNTSKIIDISRAVAREIIRLLYNTMTDPSIDFSVDIENNEISVEYDTALSVDNVIYKYANVSFSVLNSI